MILYHFTKPINLRGIAERGLIKNTPDPWWFTLGKPLPEHPAQIFETARIHWVGTDKRSRTFRYIYPEQETKLREGTAVHIAAVA